MRPPEKSLVMTAPRRAASRQILLVKIDTRRVEKLSQFMNTEPLSLHALRKHARSKCGVALTSCGLLHNGLLQSPASRRGTPIEGYY
jgi:hypothetical protein